MADVDDVRASLRLGSFGGAFGAELGGGSVPSARLVNHGSYRNRYYKYYIFLFHRFVQSLELLLRVRASGVRFFVVFSVQLVQYNITMLTLGTSAC